MGSRYFISIIIISIMLASCASFVKLDAGAERIRIINMEQASMCNQIGEVFVEVTTKVGGVHLNRAKVKEAAQNLARNQALGFDADSVAPLDELSTEGKQTYGIYECK